LGPNQKGIFREVVVILFIQNDARVPAGFYGETLGKRKVPHFVWRPFAGEAPPPIDALTGAIVLGGYMGVHETVRFPFLLDVKRFMSELLARELPLLGICLGGQLLAEVLGGKVWEKHRGERGLQPINLTPEGRTDPLFRGFPERFAAFQWHQDSFDLPPGGLHLAGSTGCPFQAFRFGAGAYGLQFHPEVDSAIVASWAGPFDPQGTFLADFEAGVNPHRKMSLNLMENFLGTFPL
jgi:GMP synthase (glutamine-hydrolysing)